ncbi:hypothetical protein CJ030_MR6G019376 [Morella rubra]|uniref:Myb/SANT-like domain-containing protein n=1 Tax=Morella rubra TaxID=262757 RepID=A0A6A1VEW3_9ROSI|nr:hypothetical protein CJ030_MR6G019373 [Morella rubra]KAB1209630.1 hypothetical protein CJ030_MR6G019376 [Morella rubra]
MAPATRSASLARCAVKKAVEEGADVPVTQEEKKFSTLLRDPTEFGWDPETNTVTASEEVLHKHLDKKGLENYNLLELVFNESTATGALAHGSSEAPGNTDDEDVVIERMEARIHIDIAAGVGIGEEMEGCQTNEGAHVSNSSIRSGATGQHSRKQSRGSKKKPSQAVIMNETFLAMTEVCKVRAQHINSKMEAS